MGDRGVFVDDEDAELLRFHELAPRVAASDDDIRLLGYRARNFRADAFEQRGQLIARIVDERTSKDDGLAIEIVGYIDLIGSEIREIDAVFAEVFDDFAFMFIREEGDDALRGNGSDVIDFEQVFFREVEELIETTETSGEDLRGLRTDLFDAKAEEKFLFFFDSSIASSILVTALSPQPSSSLISSAC